MPLAWQVVPLREGKAKEKGPGPFSISLMTGEPSRMASCPIQRVGQAPFPSLFPGYVLAEPVIYPPPTFHVIEVQIEIVPYVGQPLDVWRRRGPQRPLDFR